MEQLAPFKIIGISIESTNENGQAAHDLGELWQKFYVENILGKIPNAVGNEVYSIYTDYETDYTGKYTAIIGLKVSSIEDIPDGMVGREFKGGTYTKFVAKGPMPDAIVDTWKEIWEKDNLLSRKYTADFEFYGAQSQNGENSEVDIYIAT
jgi:predicted transcriptional regulator YdeE